MKKKIITLLVMASMMLYPVAAFAGTEGAEVTDDQQNEAVLTEEAAVEEEAAAEEAAEPEEEAAAEEEAVVEEAAEPEEEAAAEEEAVTAGEPAATAEEDVVVEEATAAEETVVKEKAMAGEDTVQTGWNSDRTIYYDENGNPTVGLFKAAMKDGVGALFYADSKGKVVKTTGIITVYGNETRFLRSKDAEGHWGFRKVSSSDKNTYVYFIGTSGQGAIAEESKFYETNKGTYFVQSNGTVRMSQGFITVGGKKYYVQSNGKVKTSEGWIRYNNKKYRIEKNGVVRTKEGSFTVGSYRYVIKSDGSVCTKKGPVSANGKLYYVRDTKGHLGVYKSYKLSGKIYHVTKNGVIKVARHKWKNGKLYYSTKKGFLKTKSGIVKLNGERFHVKKGGLVTVNQKFTFNNRSYIADKNGTIKTGLFTWKGTLYYAGTTGILKPKAGIVKVGNYSYYVAAGGVVYVNQKFTSKGSTYIADKEGHLQNGFFTWNGSKYYGDTEFAIAVNKKFWVDGKMYIAGTQGSICKNLFTWGGVYYLADSQGVVNTKEGLISHSGKNFYNRQGGGLYTEKWLLINGKHYYAGEHAAFYTKGFRYNGVWIKSAEISSDGAVAEDAYQRAMAGGSDANAEG